MWVHRYILLTCFREVTNSNLGQGIDYPGQVYIVFPSTSKLGYDNFVSLHF